MSIEAARLRGMWDQSSEQRYLKNAVDFILAKTEEKEKRDMTIDEEKIREAAGDEGERLKEACVRTYCEVLDAIRLVEAEPLKARMVSMWLRRDSYGPMAEKYLPKLWARWEEAEAAAWRKADEEIAKMPWWKRWWWR